MATERANKIAARVADAVPAELYDYLSGPLREEVVEELVFDDQVEAVITRNNYGALVLNSATVLFADIDLPPTGFTQWLFSLFRKSRDSATDELVQKIDQLCQRQPELGIRLYRTKAGFRAAVTSRGMDPNSAESETMLGDLGSDRLYVKLCKTQESFRARLTPKPWRIGMERPPCRYPYASREHEQQMRRWLDAYELKSKPVVACALIGQFGSKRIPEYVELVLEVHDRYACGQSEPLA